MNKLNIVDLLSTGYDKFDNVLSNIIESNNEYQEALEVFDKGISSLEKNTRLEVESCESRMETIAKETAFNEGFKMGVRLILGCVNSGMDKLDI